MEYKGQHYEEAEPRLFDLRLRVLVVSMALMALALLIRGERAFGKIAGMEYVYNAHTSLAEGLGMALGVSLATVVVLLFWDAKARRSWEFAGLIVGAGLEGFNSFLSATMSTGGVAWLVSREFTMFVLSVGSVMAWVIAGKLFAQAYSRHLKDYRAWHRRATTWYNSLIAADTAEEERQERLRTLREERHQRKQELAASLEQGTCPICGEHVGAALITEGKCPTCLRSAEGKTHALPHGLSLEVLSRDDWVCYYCGRDMHSVPAGERHIDHFIPRSRGGEDAVTNLVTSCAGCNLSKSDKMPSEGEVLDFSYYRLAKRAGSEKKSQILALAHSDKDEPPPKQKDIARILRTSQGYVSSVIKEASDNGPIEIVGQLLPTLPTAIADKNDGG